MHSNSQKIRWMLFNKLCPVCHCRTSFYQIHRTVFEKYVAKKEWNKYQCNECESEFFFHRYKDSEMKISKRCNNIVAP